MWRLSRLAQLRAMPFIQRQTLALKQSALKQSALKQPALNVSPFSPFSPFSTAPRFYSVPPKTHFQKGDSPPEGDTSGPQSYFQGSGSDTAPPPPPPIKKPRSKTRILITVLLLTLVSGATFILWMVDSKLPLEVVKLRNKGLEAENAGNFQEAIKYYIETLEEADVQGVSPVLEGYVHIQLLLAIKYEKLNDTKAAIDLMKDMCAVHVDALSNDKVPEEERPDVIKSGLRHAIKLAQLIRENSFEEDAPDAYGQLAKMVTMAQENILQRFPKYSDLMSYATLTDTTQQIQERKELQPKAAAQAKQMRGSGRCLWAWRLFRNELLTAREMIGVWNLVNNKFYQAIHDQHATNCLIFASGFKNEEPLLGLKTLAFLYYLQAERLENRIDDESVLYKDTGEPVSLDMIETTRKKFLEISESICHKVVESVTSLTPAEQRTRPAQEAHARCTHLLGSVAMKRGELDKARELLGETRSQAQAIGNDILVEDAESQLSKVDQLALEGDTNRSNSK